jgi:hypothetical protein
MHNALKKFMSISSRRDFLINSAPLLGAPFLLPFFAQQVRADYQGEWRICKHCYGLFFNGFPGKGACVANGVRGHEAQADGFNFHLEWGDLVETADTQINWRYCDKCQQMFFDGFPVKGTCPADIGHSSTGVMGGSGHRAYGYKFRLRHDAPGSAGYQEGWRYCENCMVMFWDGWENKGRCPKPKGGFGHKAFGYKFLLLTTKPISAKGRASTGPDNFHARSDLHTDGWAPIRGWVDISAKRDGTYTFSGHMHNSGAINIRFTLATALVAPNGQSFAFSVENKRLDGTEVLIDRDRDFDWSITKHSPDIARMWRDFSKSQLTWRLVASSAVGTGLRNYLEKIVLEAYKLLPDLSGTKEIVVGRPLKWILNL